MKTLVAAAAVAALALTPAFADCIYPQAPGKLPDGNTATLKQMLAGMKTVGAYNQKMNAYLACIKLEQSTALANGGTKLTKKQKAEIQAIEIQKHNAAVDQLHAVADQFNNQVKIYKAKHAKSQ